jgi:diguanylate cyclase (GGDEF)-like protein
MSPRKGARRLLSADAGVWSLNLAIVAASGLLLAGPVQHLPELDYGVHLPWWGLALGFLAAERCVVHLHFRRSAHSFSLGDLPLVFGLLFATPIDLVIAGLVGPLLVLLIDRRLPAIKVVFNIAQFTLATCLAVILFHELAALVDGFGPLTWGFALVSAQLSAFVTVLLIGAAISISEGRLGLKALGRMLLMDLTVTITNSSLALAGAVIVVYDPRALPLLVVPLVTVFLAYRAYATERQRHESLEFLYETTRTLSRSPEIVGALEGLLARSVEAFRAEIAEIVLFPSENNPPLRTTLGPGDARDVMQPIDPAIAEELRALVDQDEPVTRVEPTSRSPRLRRYLEERGVTHAMLAMLPGETRIVGTMLLANRPGVVRDFSDADLRLFETLATNASVALQYDRLEQTVWQLRELQRQLEHQAYHDSLTGLANRTLFIDRVDEALAKPDPTVAVLFVDIDDFKTVNDTLGHTIGDQLLIEVAKRLCSCVRPTDTVARFGGDEFAVLLDRLDGPEDVVVVAERILAALANRVPAGDEAVSVGASVGIAVNHADATRAGDLIRDADVAMYEAKQQGKGRWARFERSMHTAILRRHGLKEQLQQAVARGEFAVEYQPIARLATGDVVAAEALVRWRHPERGLVGPGEFIPLAEETGLIVPIGEFVLDEACRRAAAGRDVGMHVNLSAVELQHVDVLERVSSTLRRHRLDPRQLTLEITESVLVDVGMSATLRELHETGVRLALDDFGTGYSSLSYLRSFPLDVLKIAKPFVDGVTGRREERSFVRLIVELAGTLGLEVVAEGIESAAQLAVLREMGCDLGQGYHLSPPLSTATIQDRIRIERPSTRPAGGATAVRYPG